MNRYRLLGLALVLAITGFTFFSNFPTTSYASDTFSAIEQYKSIDKSEEGIQEYKQIITRQNQDLIKSKLDGISSTITFVKPLTYEELIAYIEKYDINPVQIQARALQGDTRVTIATKFCADFDVITKSQTEYFPGSEFVGYTDIYATIDYKNIKAIQDDEYTYLLDSSADNYFSGNDEQDGNERNKDRKGSHYAHALTWLLEDINK